MSDEPEPGEAATPERAKLRQFGLGSVSILVVFMTIISLMCLGSAFIVVVLVLRAF